MFETFLKYCSVYFSSMFKFVLGPLAGTSAQLSVPETSIFTVLGMMTTVVIIMLLGGSARLWLAQKLRIEEKLQSSNAKIKMIWEKYGIQGVAFLTPVIFTPVGGAIIAVLIGGSRRVIIKYMLVSAIFWGVTISFLFERVGVAILGF